MAEGLWLPAGALSRVFERGPWPALGQGTTGSGLVPMGVAFTGAFASLTDRQAFPFTLDPTTLALRTTAAPAPPPTDTLRVAIDGVVVGANQVLVPAPVAPDRIRVFHLSFLMRSGPGGTVRLHEGGGAAITGTFTSSVSPPPGSTQIGWTFDAPGGLRAIELTAGVALEVDVSAAAGAIDGIVIYTVGP